MLEELNQLDTDIFLFFNSFHNCYSDNFMEMFSGRYIWIPMYVGLLYMMMRRFTPVKLMLMLIGIGLSIILADQICASVLRPIFERLRPSNINNPLSEFTHIVNDYRGGAYGFPSCHAANSFALATFATAMIRHRSFSFFIITWAIINSYSRIYLGVHYPGDLLVGGIIGISIGIACFSLTNRVCKILVHKHQDTVAPPLLCSCLICNKLEHYFTKLPDSLKNLGAMGLVAFITTIYILLTSIFS